MSTRTRVWQSMFAIACLLTLALEVLPGRMAVYDEAFFKSAGRHWAATGSFAAPEIVGRVNVQPGFDTVYFAQPPLYTFIFGVYTKLVGFGPRQCILFDALIHILLAYLTVQLACRVFRAPARYAYAVGIVVLLTGTRGRPDELAMCFAIAGILCWTLDIAPKWRALLCGVAMGLCGATSLTCLFMSPLALVVAHHRGVLKWGTAAQAVLCGFIVGLLCVAPILVHHPLAYRQLVAHAAAQSPQAEAMAGGAGHAPHSWIHSLKSVAVYELDVTRTVVRFGQSIAAVFIGALCLIGLCIQAMPKEESRGWKQSAAAALCGMGVLWLILPRYVYLWFFGPWLLSLSAVVLARVFSTLRRGVRAMVVLVCAASAVVVFGLYAKDRLIMLALPREQAFYGNMARVRELVPAGARVATGEYWWAIADRCQVVDPNLSHPVPLELDYIIKTGNGSGVPGKPTVFSGYFEEFARANHFVVVEDDLNRNALKIAGIRLTNSAWGFGPYILARSSDRTGMRQSPVSGLPN